MVLPEDEPVAVQNVLPVIRGHEENDPCDSGQHFLLLGHRPPLENAVVAAADVVCLIVGEAAPARMLSADANTLIYQVPGGTLSNLIGQLKKANAMDKYYEVLAEVPRIRKDFGYPPLVTPPARRLTRRT